MLSLTTIYGLFVLSSLLLFNALLILARYVQQTKNPPSDEEFEALEAKRQAIENDLQEREARILSLELQLKDAQTRLSAAEAQNSPEAAAS